MNTKAAGTKKILLIGWEAAEWNIIEPLLGADELPNLNRLIETGSMGRMATLDPPIQPLAWTSIATGKAPQDHGILGLEQPAENGVDAQPISSESRRCKALWNLLSESGKRCHVIGWPATHPAEEINGVMLSSMWDAPLGDRDVPWPLDKRAVTPASFAETAVELRMHPGELTLNDLRPFIPAIQSSDSNDPAIFRLGQAVAIAASRQAATTYLIENEPWDFMAVYFPSLDEIARQFIEFHPPQMAHLENERFARFSNVVTETYRFHDQMLGRLIELAGSDTTVIVCSTSGMHTGELRAVPDSSKAVSYMAHHRPAGILFIGGARTKQDELIYGATIYDLAPTILTVTGLGIPRDMVGRPLVEAFSDSLKPFQVDATPPNPPRRMATKRRENGMPSRAMLAELENDFNLARCLQASARHDLALPLLERMHLECPLRISPALHLIHCYRALGRTEDASKTLETFADWLGKNQVERPAAFLPNFNLMRGLLALDCDDRETAASYLAAAEKEVAQLPAMQLQLGQIYARLRKPKESEAAFRRALELDSENAEANAGLSASFYRQRRYEEALDAAFSAAAHAPLFGRNHLQVARCLARLRRDDEALVAIEHALRRMPALIEAHRLAVVLHRRNGSGPSIIDQHKQAIARILPVRKEVWKVIAIHQKKLASQRPI